MTTAVQTRRGQSRRVALQALYQWLQADTELGDLILQFDRSGSLRGADREYFRLLVRGVVADTSGLEQEFDAILDRPAAQLDPVERAALLLAVFELRECLDVPYRVVLNEATELTKSFGAEGGHRFVNGVLDKVAHRLRAVECRANA